MHLHLIKLFQLNYPAHVSNKQVCHPEVISIHVAYIITHTTMRCLADNTILFISVHVAYIITHTSMGCLALTRYD
jgi:hypothetical protein